MKITNNSDIPLALAVWAMDDDYDYVPKPNYISATSIIKPLRQIVLSQRVDPENQEADVQDYIARAMGTSLHSSIEYAWTKHYQQNLRKLGYPEAYIDRIVINPGSVEEGQIPIYIEQRRVKELNGYLIGGKFDMVLDGVLQDVKSTSVAKWMNDSSTEDYRLQGSIYKWLNPDIITSNYIRINFLFTDWSKASALKSSSYPQTRAAYKDIPLMTVEETEEWLKNKLDDITKFSVEPESVIPECSDKELWRTPTKYKFFSKPDAVRASKVFDSFMEAYRYQQVEKRGMGVIKTFPGEAKRCNYCLAADICSQRNRMKNGSSSDS